MRFRMSVAVTACLYLFLFAAATTAALSVVYPRFHLRRSDTITRTETNEFVLAPGTTVRINHGIGDVTVSTWAGSSLRIESVKTMTGEGGLVQAQHEYLDHIKLAPKTESDTLTISATYPDGGRNARGSVDLHVFVPERIDVEVATLDGDIRCDQLAGSLDVTTVAGEIRVGRIVGDLYARAINGDIHVGHVTRQLAADTLHGDVRITGQALLDKSTVAQATSP